MKYEPFYPNTPGHRGNRDTSIAAAIELAPKLKSIQIRIADAIRLAGSAGLTSDEAADATGINIYTSRARTAELRAMGWIKDSRQRRPNSTGRRAIVWTWVVPEARPAPEPANDAHDDRCPTCGALISGGANG